MTPNQIKIQYLVHKFRYKHKDDLQAQEALNRILWWSYPVVYPNHEIETTKIQKAIDARKRKKRIINRYLEDMADWYDELYFVTLTFSDDALNGTSERTRHRYVQTWLNENCRDYYANVDYGEKNGREHFHAVVAFKSNIQPWKYGFDSAKKIKSSTEGGNRHKISGYMLKLTNHAAKLGTGKSFRKKIREDVDSLPF